jgi:hypothetical protein
MKNKLSKTRILTIPGPNPIPIQEFEDCTLFPNEEISMKSVSFSRIFHFIFIFESSNEFEVQNFIFNNEIIKRKVLIILFFIEIIDILN